MATPSRWVRLNDAPAQEPLVVTRDIPGYVGYRVGVDGSVWTCRKRGSRGLGKHWRKLNPKPHPVYGYIQVGLICTDGRVRLKFVHRLVLEAFIGPCPDGMEACHNDGDPANNRLENLRWDTHVANMADSKRHGTMPLGSRKKYARLVEADIPEIRMLNVAGFSTVQIAEVFSVSASTIRCVLTGRTWRHVP